MARQYLNLKFTTAINIASSMRASKMCEITWTRPSKHQRHYSESNVVFTMSESEIAAKSPVPIADNWVGAYEKDWTELGKSESESSFYMKVPLSCSHDLNIHLNGRY